ncbi:thiomuracin/GE37468 family thiazolyl RiPP peptide [Nocardia sp. NPDC003979]
MGLNVNDLPVDIQGLDIDDLEIETLTTGLGASETTPASCCSVPCSCCCCSSTCCSG